MSGPDSIGVTLAHVDPSLLSCWEGMVKRGEECSLLLKHSKGRVVATLQCATPCPYFPTSYFVFCSEDEEKVEEEGKREEEVGGPTCLPPTPGGGERPASQQTDEATRCCF